MHRLEIYGVAIAAFVVIWQISDRVVAAHLTGLGDRVSSVQHSQEAFQAAVLGRIDNQDDALANALEALTLEVNRLELANRELNTALATARAFASDFSDNTVSPAQFEVLVSEVASLGELLDQQSVQAIPNVLNGRYMAVWARSIDEAMRLHGQVDNASRDAIMAKYAKDIAADGGVVVYSPQRPAYPNSETLLILDGEPVQIPFVSPQR